MAYSDYGAFVYCDGARREGKEEIEVFEWGKISFEYKGYKFLFVSGNPNFAEMTEPDGTHWECNYDYFYGAGF